MDASLGRVAVLSDIHGVLPALEAVLAEPEVFSYLRARARATDAEALAVMSPRDGR